MSCTAGTRTVYRIDYSDVMDKPDALAITTVELHELQVPKQSSLISRALKGWVLALKSGQSSE